MSGLPAPVRIPTDQVAGFRALGRPTECPKCGATASQVLVEVRAGAPKPAALCRECNVFWERA